MRGKDVPPLPSLVRSPRTTHQRILAEPGRTIQGVVAGPTDAGETNEGTLSRALEGLRRPKTGCCGATSGFPLLLFVSEVNLSIKGLKMKDFLRTSFVFIAAKSNQIVFNAFFSCMIIGSRTESHRGFTIHLFVNHHGPNHHLLRRCM